MPIQTAEQLALAKKVRDHIAEHPEQHDQACWYRQNECGTVACIAGWTAVPDGAQPDLILDEEDLDEAASVRLPDGSRRQIAGYARKALGLTENEAYQLFHRTPNEAVAAQALDKLIADGEAAVSGATR